MTDVHPTAVVDPTVKLVGDNIAIGAYAVVGPNVTIGAGCRVGAHAVIHKNTTMGQGNRICSYASIGGDSQSRHDHPDDAGFLEIGDFNTFHEFCSINRGSIHDSGKTVIGNRNIFMAYSHVGHDCCLEHSIVMVNQATLAGHVQIKSHAIIGHSVGIRQYCKIGVGAFIDRLVPINKDVMAFTMVRGVPAKAVGINKIGLERLGYNAQLIKAFEESYRIVFRRGLPAQQIEEQLGIWVAQYPELQCMLDMIQQTERGLCR